jgi:serine/threonine protein kinase/tetratricopeptide (TPR) repeat protein/TolB-like protein
MFVDNDRLTRLAEAVVDGTPVDWAKELSSTPDLETRQLVEKLRVLANVAAVHRVADDSTRDAMAGLEPETVRTAWGPLELRRTIGEGSFGTVYLAWDPRLEREVALKILHRSPRSASVIREGRLLASIRHPNVVNVYGVDEFDDAVGLRMELVDGLTLKQTLQQRGVFGAYETALIGTDLCRAVAAVHKAGLVHRDIKAQNVMREAGGRIVLMDFGAGEVRARQDDPWRRPTGTPLYLAPEVLGGQPATAVSDIYSIGVLLYHLLTMRYPVEGSTIAELETAHASHRATPISDLRPDLPAGVVQVIERALDRDPARRPRSAGAMQQELLATIAPAPAPSHSDGSVPSAINLVADLTAHTSARDRTRDLASSGWRRLRESRWLKTAAATVLLGVFAVLIIWSYRDRLGRSMTGMLLPDKKIVVVLPFRVIGANKEEGLYSEGVSVVLTSNLAQLGQPDLQVMPSTEVREAQIETVERARAEFGATLVLSGVVQFSGDQVRASYSLIRTADRRELIGRSRTLAAGDPFALQDVVTRDVLTMLEAELPQGTPLETRLVFGTRDDRAFFLYTQARGAMQNYHEQENVDAAIKFLTEAVARDPQYAIAYAALGRARWENFSTSKRVTWLDRAGEACETSASLSPQLSEAQYCLGLVEESRGQYEQAIESYRRAIDYSPGNEDAHRALGSVLDKLERVDEAEAAYMRAIELRPGYWAGYARLGQFYNLRNDYQKAGDYYEQALILSPDNARVLFSLGLVFSNKGQYERAIEFLERAIQLRPYLASPYTNLGLAYLRARRYNEAVAPLERAFSAQGTYQTAGNLARIYWLTGRKDEARQKYEFGIRDGEERLQMNPRDHGIHVLVGRYYAMLGRKSDALRHLDQALLMHPDDAHYLTIAADSQVVLGDRSRALSLMEAAARLGHTAAQFLGEPELDALKTEPRYRAVMSANGPGR